MRERYLNSGCRFFLLTVLLIMGGLTGGTSSGQQGKPDKPDQKEEVKEKTVNFAMDGKPWAAVFERLTEITGKPVVSDSDLKVPGAIDFNGQRKKEYTIPEVIHIINDALLTRGENKYYLINGESSFKLMEVDQHHKRFQQIDLQLSLQVGGEAAVFTRRDIARELKLSAAQETKLNSISEERHKTLLPLFLTDENAAEIEKKVAAHTKDTFGQLRAVLNDSQQKQLDDLIGEPYWHLPPKNQRAYAMPLPGEPGGDEPDGRLLTVAAPFVSITGVLCVEDKMLQEELNLSADQVAKLIEVRDRTKERMEHGSPLTEEWRKKIAQQAKENEKDLAEILEPKQLARFKQIFLQYFKVNHLVYGLSPERRPPSLLDHCAEVAEELQLTKGQKEKIQEGALLVEVLDEKQQAMLKVMLGEPFKKVKSLSPKVVGGDQWKGRRNNELQYLREKSVQEDLKLTKEQVKKLLALIKEWEDKTEDLSTKRGTPDQWAETKEWLKKSISSILEEKQAARLHQIQLQQSQRQHSRLSHLYMNPEVQKVLELNAEQKEKLRQLFMDHESTRSLLRCELYRVVGWKLDKDFGKTLEEFEKIADKKLAAVLTPKQQTQVKELLGEPFGRNRSPANFYAAIS
jgi:hypothetical protein